MPVTYAAPPVARRERFNAAAPPPHPVADPWAELDLVELGPLPSRNPLVYVDTDDRDALDALILAGLISP
jgi:hypothetical protein